MHEFCRKNATIPVITGGIGICHLFVDESADLEAAIPLIRNAKTQNPSVCNSLDTLLVHEKIAAEFLPAVVNDLAVSGVLFRATPEAAVLVDHASVSDAVAGDFDIEWLSLTLGLKIVEGLDQALRHIDDHSTFHSDGILTQNTENAERFVQAVDLRGYSSMRAPGLMTEVSWVSGRGRSQHPAAPCTWSHGFNLNSQPINGLWWEIIRAGHERVDFVCPA